MFEVLGGHDFGTGKFFNVRALELSDYIITREAIR